MPTTDAATPVAPKETKVVAVFVKVKREVDLGFPDFMKTAKFYLRKKQQIPFGMRDASRTSFEISLTADVGDNADVDELIADLSKKAHAIADRELRVQHPETFEEAREQELPEEAFTVSSTVVDRQTAGEDY
jgi:hypothetical protein